MARDKEFKDADLRIVPQAEAELFSHDVAIDDGDLALQLEWEKGNGHLPYTLDDMEDE